MSAAIINDIPFRMMRPDRPTFRFRGGVWVSPEGQALEVVEFLEQLARDAAARPGVFPGTLKELAACARLGRAQLSQMINGHRTGRQSWKHVLPHLSVEALSHLKRCYAWNNHAEQALRAHAGEEWSRALTNEPGDFGYVRLAS